MPSGHAGVQPPGPDLRVGQQGAQEGHVGAHPEQRVPAQGQAEAAQRGGPVRAPGDHLGQHRVVAAADHAALAQPGVDPDPGQVRLVQPEHPAAGGQEAPGRVLGVHPGLDRVPGESHVFLPERQWLPRGHPELPLDQVQRRVAGHRDGQLGDRVLDLEPGVHFQEEVLFRAVGGHDVLHRPGTFVTRRPGRRDRARPHRRADPLAAGVARQQRRGRFLDDLLVPALQAAFALAEVHHVAVGVGEDLDLDVPRQADPPLDQQGGVAERGLGLTPRGGDRVGQAAGGADQPHALPAAARRRLEQHRVARAEPGRLRRPGQLGIAQPGRLAARHDRHARRRDHALGGDLVPHGGDRARGRPDEHQAVLGARPGQRGVLGQEPVAGVHGLGPAAQRRVDDVLDGQVAAHSGREVGGGGGPAAGVVGRAGDHGADAEPVQGTDDPDGDLAPVGDEDGGEHGHIRKTP